MAVQDTETDILYRDCLEDTHWADLFHGLMHLVVEACSASAAAYALKHRLKSWTGVKEKVVRKRKEVKPDYKASDISDCSGFGVVSLFNADIPDALAVLLAELRTFSGTPVGLADVVEIGIHSNRKLGDPLPIVRDVERVWDEFGAAMRLKPEKADHKFSSYSSVHLVLSKLLESGGQHYQASS